MASFVAAVDGAGAVEVDAGAAVVAAVVVGAADRTDHGGDGDDGGDAGERRVDPSYGTMIAGCGIKANVSARAHVRAGARARAGAVEALLRAVAKQLQPPQLQPPSPRISLMIAAQRCMLRAPSMGFGLQMHCMQSMEGSATEG